MPFPAYVAVCSFLISLSFGRGQNNEVSIQQAACGTRRIFTVAVEGNIGSGKSTFLDFFKQFTSIHVMEEPLNEWLNISGRHNALELLYKNPKRWSYLFNQNTMLSRLKQYRFDTNQSVKLVERSLYSAHHVFARNSHERGEITDIEFDVLDNWFNYLASNDDIHVDLFVYLRAPPDICWQRLHYRGRKEERSLPLEFVTRLHDLYENLMLKDSESKLPAPVLVVNASLEVDQMLEKYEQLKQTILSGRA